MQVRKMVEEALTKHGLKSASQRAKMKEQLYEEMEEALQEQVLACARIAWMCVCSPAVRSHALHVH